MPGLPLCRRGNEGEVRLNKEIQYKCATQMKLKNVTAVCNKKNKTRLGLNVELQMLNKK